MFPIDTPTDLIHPTAGRDHRLDLAAPFELRGSRALEHIARLTSEANDDRTIRLAARGHPSPLRRRLGLALMGLGDRIAGSPQAMRPAA